MILEAILLFLLSPNASIQNKSENANIFSLKLNFSVVLLYYINNMFLINNLNGQREKNVAPGRAQTSTSHTLGEPSYHLDH